MGAGKSLARALRKLPLKKKKLTDSIADGTEYRVEAKIKDLMKKETEKGMPWLKRNQDTPKLTKEEVKMWLKVNETRTTPAQGTPDALKGGNYVGWGLSKRHKKKYSPKYNQ
jgi:hypothetical protein